MASDFKNPDSHLSQADADTVAALVAAAADITLVVDGGDVIRDLSHNLDRVSAAGMPAWRGRPIGEVVRVDSRESLTDVLRSVRSGRRAERFDITHLLDSGRELPVQYSALRIGSDGQIVLMGRDLRLVAELQSRLLANRQSLEQNAKQQRQAEAQYRLLFETASEAIVIVEAASGRIREANPRATAILNVGSVGPLPGRKFASLFGKPGQGGVQALLAGVLASGMPATMHVEPDALEKPLVLAAELFRAGDLNLILVRLSVLNDAAGATHASESGLAELVRNAGEAVLLTDAAGIVVWANASFLALADIPLAAHAAGKPLGAFFQWSGIEQGVLLENIDRHGRVQNFSGLVKGGNGKSTAVDLSAVSMRDATPPGYGFVMRTISDHDTRTGRGNSDLTRTAEHLVEMIGRAPLKELIRDTTDVIEKMCIEAALNLTGNNRASAARVLGLSRQALYLKLNRFGIAEE